MSKRHQPISWVKYMDIHETAMDRFHKDGIVINDSLTWNLSEFPVVILSGQIELRGGLILEVLKSLIVTNHTKKSRGQIQSQDYSYNLRRKGKKNSAIFRYDSWHVHAKKGHEERFHKHVFDINGKETEIIEFKLKDWPELSRVIDEANQYYLDHLAPKVTGPASRAKRKKRSSVK